MVSTKTSPPTRNSRRRTPSVGPAGLSPLEERAQSVLALVAGPHACGELGKRPPVARIGLDESFRLAHGFGACGNQFRDHVLRARRDLADEADAQRIVG